MKKCSKCKNVKELSEYTNCKSGKFGVHHYCKKCHSQQRKDNYNYDRQRIRHIMFKYKLSESDLNKMYVAQNGKCKICSTEYKEVSKHNNLYVDHCHKTGNVRGLLCFKCNRLLGVWDDNIDILKSAIKYLKEEL
jgi:hypothetical protein